MLAPVRLVKIMEPVRGILPKVPYTDVFVPRDIRDKSVIYLSINVQLDYMTVTLKLRAQVLRADISVNVKVVSMVTAKAASKVMVKLTVFVPRE